jgi:RimJ/RimL family protein N-acetyltransferase
MMTKSSGHFQVEWQLPVDFRLRGDQLDLVPSGPMPADESWNGIEGLSEYLKARLPDEWPPEDVEDPEASGGWWDWHIVLHREGGDVAIGTLGLRGWPSVNGTVRIGCSLLPEFQVQGYGTHAVSALTDWLLTQGNVQTVAASTPVGNERSEGILRHLGFNKTDSDEPGFLRYVKQRG